MENLYKKWAQDYLKKKYPQYKIGFWTSGPNRVVSCFHAKSEGDHIIGEVHMLPLSSKDAMPMAAIRIDRLIKEKNIEVSEITKLIFAPKSICRQGTPEKRQKVLARITKKQEKFKKKTGVQIVLMPTRNVFMGRVRKLKEHARKAKKSQKLAHQKQSDS